MNIGMLIVQAIVLTAIVSGIIIFILKKVLFDSTQGAVNRLNRETEDVREKQQELTEKIKQANEELKKRREEADALVAKMKEDAKTRATEERNKIMSKAREEAAEVLDKAQRTKDDIRKVLEKEMEMKTIDFTVILMGEVLSEQAKGTFNQMLITEFLKNLETVDMEMIGEDMDTADVVTASPLEESLKSRLSEILKGKLNREIKVNVQVDPKVISGMLLRFGGLSLDGSLQHMLKEKGVEVKEKIEKGLLKFDS